MAVTPVGTHCILELYDCSPDLLNDVLVIRDAIEQASKQSLSTLLDLRSHQFYPQGVTAVALLAESHLSIHTWPEYGYAGVDVFTCGEDAKPEQACEYLVRRLGSRKHNLRVLTRGVAASDAAVRPQPARVPETCLCQVRK